MASTPGNGSTNPFGNGAGGAGGNNVAGNNFLTNPGGGGRSGRGRTFHDQKPAPQQPRERAADRNMQDAAPGTLVPMPNAKPDADVGVGSVGNPAKPYRLGA